MLILPTEPADAGLSERFQDRNLDRLTLDCAITETRLYARDIDQRFVVDSFNGAIAQRAERGAQSTAVLCVGHMLLHIRADGPVVNKRAPRDCASMDRHRRVHEVSVIVSVADTNFRDLAGAAADRF